MIDAKAIKEKALSLGAQVVGIGDIRAFDGVSPQRDPKMILPSAKCVLGFGFAVPRGLYFGMEKGTQYYGYTTLGVKYIYEEMAEIFLLKMGAFIENEGYDACLQKSIPNLRIKGDKTTNPEVADTYELIHAEAVEHGKPAPDVMIDFALAAKACGIGSLGLNGRILNPQYGPFMRYCFIITDLPLKADLPLREPICDRCGDCIAACDGHAVSEKGLDTWQCAVYYNGANGLKNPFMPPDAFKNLPDRMEIICGKKPVTAESAKRILDEIFFYPPAQHAYQCSICGRACDTACYAHLEKKGVLSAKYKQPFKKREPWSFHKEDFEL